MEPFCMPYISVQWLCKLSQALCCYLLDLSSHLVPSIALCSHKRNAVVQGLNLMSWLAVDQQLFYGLGWCCMPSGTIQKKEFWRTGLYHLKSDRAKWGCLGSSTLWYRTVLHTDMIRKIRSHVWQVCCKVGWKDYLLLVNYSSFAEFF